MLRGPTLLLLASFLFPISTQAQSKENSKKSREGAAADLVLLNGMILTLDAEDRQVCCLAVRGREIMAVGSEPEIKRFVGSATRIINLKGRMGMPGFVDAHSHTTGVLPDYLDLTQATSVADIARAVEQKAKKTAPGQWIVGAGPFMIWRGWDDQRLKEKRLLARADLDPVSPHHPVLLMKDAGHERLRPVSGRAARIVGGG
jgi:hypothetical protein